MSRSWTALTLLIAVAPLAGGCATKKPRVEREPARYAPAESDERRLSRIQEKVDELSEKVRTWIVEVEAHRAREPRSSELDASLEGLREVRDRLQRLRGRVHEPPEGGAIDELEQEVLHLADAAEKNHERALRAVER